MEMDLIHYLVWLFEHRGKRLHADGTVSQIDHALQCAALAETGGASEDLIAACLLHDVGRLMDEPETACARRAVDARHQFRPLPLFKRYFPESVVAPVRLHVCAKRYLCAVQPGYWDGLSPASRTSLQRQGGIYTQAEAERFIREPYARDAVRLRLWDDRAKVAGRPTPHLQHYVHVLLRRTGEGAEGLQLLIAGKRGVDS